MFDHMVGEGFLSLEDRENVLFSDDIAEIEDFITNYKVPSTRQY
ncbi:TIGR00730 family Rossman fold protein, partial [Streptococcus agalactiae]|nr:TIGR00730 family Rossman fold protein [Streptococcus agalactiae]